MFSLFYVSLLDYKLYPEHDLIKRKWVNPESVQQPEPISVVGDPIEEPK
jgi:hypothetical protein